jgi:hypothetical protein
LIKTEVWRDKTEAELELRTAWANFFKSAIKSTVAGAVTIGITPIFSLGRLSVGSVLAGTAAAAPWVVAELINIFDKRLQAEQHGMYYLLNFRS